MGNVIKTQQTELYWASIAGVVNKAVSITGVTGLSGPREPVDTSNLDTGVDRTYIAGSGSPGQVSVSFNVRRGELAHRALMNLRDSGDVVSWGVYSSEAATVPTAMASVLQSASGRVSARFMGFVSDVSVDMSGNSIWRGTIVIQRSGSITWDLMTPEEEIAAMFAAGEQGAWFDPSDWSTLFQDAAGTIPVTALEQPVGRMLDKSGRGNHAMQATAGSRPVLSARVNMLTYSEQFDNAAWVKVSAGTGSVPVVNANAQPAPDGTMTADEVTFAIAGGTTSGDFSILSQLPLGVTSGGTYSARVWVRALSAGDVGKKILFRHVAGGAFLNYTLTAGWVEISRSEVAVPSAPLQLALRGDVLPAAGTVGVAIWGAQVNPGPTVAPYQRINAATDYNANGFPVYLRFDGTDDSMATASVDFTGTNKVTVIGGLRKGSDAALSVVAELSVSTASNNGGFLLAAPSSNGAPNYGMFARGSAYTGVGATGYAAPVASVVSGWADIAASFTAIRVNGGATASSLASLGGGNFGNYPLYLGRRAGASSAFTGNLYGLISIGRLLTAPELAASEALIAQRTGVTL